MSVKNIPGQNGRVRGLPDRRKFACLFRQNLNRSDRISGFCTVYAPLAVTVPWQLFHRGHQASVCAGQIARVPLISNNAQKLRRLRNKRSGNSRECEKIPQQSTFLFIFL